MLWLLAGILALGLGGAATLLLGLRGRRIDDHPVCRRCGFDLIGQAPRAYARKGNAPVASPAPEGPAPVATGQPAEPAQPVESDAHAATPQRGPRSAVAPVTLDRPEDAATMASVCSECGADLARRRAVRLGQRRRRPAVATVGALALLIALGAAGAISWGAATKYDWNTVKPVWLLARELQSTDSAVAKAATDELRRRLPGDGLAPMRDGQRDTRAAERLARHILEYQADTSRPWNPGAGEIFERMWQMKLLRDEMFHQYVRQSSPVSVHVRPRIVQGEPLAVRFDVEQRSGGGGLIAIHAELVDITIDGEPVPSGYYRFSIKEGWPGAPWSMPLQPVVSFEFLDLSDRSFRPGRPRGIELPSGSWPVRLRLVVRREKRKPEGSAWTQTLNRGILVRPPLPSDSLADLVRHSGLWYGDDLPEGLPAFEVVDVETEIEIVPPGTSVVTAARGADADLVAKSITATARLERSRFTDSSSSLELRLTIGKDLPLDIAYDVALVRRDGDRPLRLLVHDVEAASTDWGHRIPVGDTTDLEPGDFLRFTFTPNPRAAARVAGIEEIAGEAFEVELIVPNDRDREIRELLESSSPTFVDPG